MFGQRPPKCSDQAEQKNDHKLRAQNHQVGEAGEKSSKEEDSKKKYCSNQEGKGLSHYSMVVHIALKSRKLPTTLRESPPAPRIGAGGAQNVLRSLFSS